MILNKPIDKDISINQVNLDFKTILEYLKIHRDKTFKDFSDYELFIYSIIDTYNFGRSFQDSIKNALFHISDREHREQYLNLLIMPDREDF